MPEGPSIYMLKEAVQPFAGKKILRAEGNTKKIDVESLAGLQITAFKSWGKHFLICLPEYTLRIHFMLFGSYLINDRKEASPRLSLRFRKGELNFYACSVIKLTAPLDQIYDWSADVMNPGWEEKKAFKKIKDHPDRLICDVLLDQNIFAGVGNIIKNEVLFRSHIHPESVAGKIPDKQLRALISDTVTYSFLFLEWKKAFTLRKHWQAYRQVDCPRDHVPFQKGKLGKTNRRSAFCPLCQELYV